MEVIFFHNRVTPNPASIGQGQGGAGFRELLVRAHPEKTPKEVRNGMVELVEAWETGREK